MAELLAAEGVSAEDFRASQATPARLQAADLVLTMTLAQRAWTVGEAPAVLKRAFTLNEFARLVAADDGPPPEARAPGEGQSGGKAKRAGKARLAVAALVAVAALAALVAALVASRGQGPALGGMGTLALVPSGDAVNAFLMDGKSVAIPGAFVSASFSVDGEKAAVLVSAAGGGGQDLYLVKDDGSFALVSRGVAAYAMAASGNGVAYASGADPGTGEASVYLYDCARNAQSLIADGALATLNGEPLLCVSPDGRTVGYCAGYDPEEQEFTAYTSTGGPSATKLGKNLYAVAIANGSRYVYYVQLDDDFAGGGLFVRAGSREVRLISDLGPGNYLAFSRDLAQLVYTKNGKTYLSTKGGDDGKLFNGEAAQVLAPSGTALARYAAAGWSYDYFALDSLLKLPYICESDGGASLYYVGSGKVASLRAEGLYPGSAGFLSSGRRRALLLDKNQDLFWLDVSREGASPESVAEDVLGFAASGDGRTCYYVDAEDDLYCVRGNAKPAKVEEGVFAPFLWVPPGTDSLFFYTDFEGGALGSGRGLLCATRGGGKPKELLDVKVGAATVLACGVFYGGGPDTGGGVAYFGEGKRRIALVEAAGGVAAPAAAAPGAAGGGAGR